VPLAEAVARTLRFYASHGLPAWAQVVVGSDTGSLLEATGWQLARPGEADTRFQLASVARATRAVRRRLPASPPPVVIGTTLTPAWLANDARALAHRDDATAVLQGPDDVAFVSLGDPADERVVAKGRVACDGDWAGITDVWVSPTHRRQGLASVVMAELLEWAAERGAGTAYLQTRGDNVAGLALYEALGFRTHHSYRYLAAPAAAG
jgi:N-acetylglutamate synthase